MSVLEQQLLRKKEMGYDNPNPGERKKIFSFAEGYMSFIGEAKTERVFVKKAIELLEGAGFKSFSRRQALSEGDKVYFINRNRALAAAVIGSESLKNGVNLIASHVDSPRLDLKPIPLYESDGALYIKTHYYGGIKKYQWATIPLSLMGTVALKSGKTVDISIGQDAEDPVFVISDILPHLGKVQSKKTCDEIIEAEQLNAYGATIPFEDEDAKEKIKLNFLYLLNKKYKINEEDLISADLCLVPAVMPRDIGLDRSLIGGYGQDDRVCAYTSLMAFLDAKPSKKTKLLYFADREEVGSMGNSGCKSAFLTNVIEELSEKLNVKVRDVLSNTVCLSADVCAAYDPNFPEAFEKNNALFLNGGTAFLKYTGARGKSGSSEASAELISYLRKIFDKGNVKWQIGELGKTDFGGGGTVAQYIANLGAEVIDSGVPVISMHSPYEVTSKFDVYMTYKGYKVFYEN